jgi:coatomer protein complex subunit gamma
MANFFVNFIKDTIKEASSSTTEAKPEVEIDTFATLQKSQVLQEAKCFNDKQINEKKCRNLLARLVYLINTGEKFLENESTTLFFSITRLFQSENLDLRRIIYLIIKELQKDPSIYIMTASLIKDLSSKIDLFRMNALRTVSIIVEPQYLVQSERYMKNAVIDKNPAVSIAALLAGIQLFPHAPDFVKKWTNEIMEKLHPKSTATHYHALILLQEIRKQDRNSFLKVLINLAKEGTTNSLASVQMIRFIREVILSNELDPQNEKIFIDFLNKQLHKNSDMVVFEAARTLCEIKSLPNKELASTVSTLWLFLNSSNSISKFAALRIINKLISNPSRLSLINSTQEIEALLRDNNKSLSSFAISILLKVSKEEEIESLLGQIQDFLSDSSDEFKVDIVYSVRGLTRKHPKKFKTLINFLCTCLKSEGNFDFKNSIVESIELIIIDVPEAKEVGLFTLVEYIEDCQYPALHIRIMNLLAREASNITNPHKFVRLINNRIVLESADIRAAAITTLGRFATGRKAMIPEIKTILERELYDNDTEVRERAQYYLDEMSKAENNETDQLSEKQLTTEDIDAIEAYLKSNIEAIQKTNDSNLLSLDYINKFVKEHNLNVQTPKESVRVKPSDNFINPDVEVRGASKAAQDSLVQKYKQLFKANEYFANLGEVRMVLDYKSLTDAKAEYLVKLRKIFFDEYLLLEFNVTNTLSNHLLKDVTVDINFSNENLKIMTGTSVNEIKGGDSGNAYVVIAKNPELRVIPFTATDCFLKFKARDVGADGKPKGAEYEDEYQLEEVTLGVNDYMQSLILTGDKKFEKSWQELGGSQQEASYQLSYKTLDSAIKSLVKHFGMTVCDNTDSININNKYHSLLLSGLYLGQSELLLNAMIGFNNEMGCVMKLRSNSKDEVLAANILDTVS